MDGANAEDTVYVNCLARNALRQQVGPAFQRSYRDNATFRPNFSNASVTFKSG